MYTIASWTSSTADCQVTTPNGPFPCSNRCASPADNPALVCPSNPASAAQCFAKRDERTNLPTVRLLTIWLGANDAAQLPTRQHVPLARYRANLRTLVRTVAAPDSPRYSPATHVLLLTPPPVSEAMWARRQAAKDPPRVLDRRFEVTRAYADAAREVAAEEGVHVVDVWTAIWEKAEEKEDRLSAYLADGLHLTAEGYKVRRSLWGVVGRTDPCYRSGGVRYSHGCYKQTLPGDASRQTATCLPLVRVNTLGCFAIVFKDTSQLRSDRR